jgi:hypothetical protein
MSRYPLDIGVAFGVRWVLCYPSVGGGFEHKARLGSAPVAGFKRF